jgi:hypothetical protein
MCDDVSDILRVMLALSDMTIHFRTYRMLWAVHVVADDTGDWQAAAGAGAGAGGAAHAALYKYCRQETAHKSTRSDVPQGPPEPPRCPGLR